jgi:hypothetical protein
MENNIDMLLDPTPNPDPALDRYDGKGFTKEDNVTIQENIKRLHDMAYRKNYRYQIEDIRGQLKAIEIQMMYKPTLWERIKEVFHG